MEEQQDVQGSSSARTVSPIRHKGSVSRTNSRKDVDVASPPASFDAVSSSKSTGKGKGRASSKEEKSAGKSRKESIAVDYVSDSDSDGTFNHFAGPTFWPDAYSAHR